MSAKRTLDTDVTEARRSDVRRLVDRVQMWGSVRPDVRALALVGSWAREAAQMDSDVGLVLLTSRVELYSERNDWIRKLGGGSIVRTLPWGPIVERRVRMPSGLDVEFDVGSPYWAATCPVDSGTRSVMERGMRALHDPDGLLTALLRVVGQQEQKPPIA